VSGSAYSATTTDRSSQRVQIVEKVLQCLLLRVAPMQRISELPGCRFAYRFTYVEYRQRGG
jgi:hypothetical protein